MMMRYTNVVERVPPSTFGSAEILHDTPSPFERMSGAMRGMPLNRQAYVRLMIDGRCWMTDAEFERATNYKIVAEAHGDVLIAGLGIGLILDPIIAKASTVTVVERSLDVIALVGPLFPSVKTINADIFTWKPKPEASWDTIYFDVWADFSEDDRKESAVLKRRFKKHLREDGFMDSWVTTALKCSPRSRR